jgi:hypothetical protein
MRWVFTSRVAWLAALAITLFMGGLAQQAVAKGQATPPAATGQAAPAAAPGQMADMMARRQAMMTEMHAANQKLDDLVAKMNAAGGNDRIDAMAAVINELVAQHKNMGASMMSMSGMMSMGKMMSMPNDKMSRPDGTKMPDAKK